MDLITQITLWKINSENLNTIFFTALLFSVNNTQYMFSNSILITVLMTNLDNRSLKQGND